MKKGSINYEVDDWAEWLDEDEKIENNALGEGKEDPIKKDILQNDLDDINDFLDIKENSKSKKTVENKNKNKAKVSEKIITLENTPLNSIKDCETLGEILAERIKKCKAKSVSIERFISIIISACETKLDDKELQTVSRKIQAIIQKRETEKRYTLINKKKPNDTKNSIKNYKDEVDMIYGDLSYDEEDYYDEEGY